MAAAVVGAVAGGLALTVLKYVAIGVIASGAGAATIAGVKQAIEAIKDKKENNQTKKEWEAMQAEIEQKENEIRAKQAERKDYLDELYSNIVAKNKANEQEKDNTLSDSIVGDATGGKQNNNNEENEKKEESGSALPIPIPGGNGSIQDTTNDNIESSVSGVSSIDEWKKWAKEQQQRLWAREDAIRKETQQREDTAWQRSVEDMKKAGINPNLINAQPAESGGGITQATQMDMSTIANQMDIDSEKLQQLIDQAFEGKENQKQQFMDIFGNLLQTIVFAFVMRGKGG